MVDQERGSELATMVGRKLHEFRLQRGLTLERLARLSGVSRAMLWQIEQARSAPTITVLARIAEALGVQVSAFLDLTTPAAAVVLRRADARILRAEHGAVSIRALSPATGSGRVTFHEVRLEPGAMERRESHSDGTVENLVVSEGSVEVDVGSEVHLLHPGDAIFLRSGAEHGYRNVAPGPVVIYRVTVSPTAGTPEAL
jgi:transcriptional regulator with XRE-family HTH domain